ncbi:hypothetical protein HYU92_01590 [Candidatus Curtissbacteria bacterium]|nr:hypothetical protein [Candidatus Curtissbacteria bacterium]
MLKNAKKLIGPALSIAALAFPAVALAQTNIVPNNIVAINNIIFVVRAIIRFILVVAFVIAFVMLLIGGVRWILAGGDEKAVSGARSTITAALIGLVIILVAYAIIRLVELFFGVPIISNGVVIPTVTD